QVATQQCEVVLVVDLTDAAQAIDGMLVIKVADQRITGVGGNGKDRAFAQHLCRLLEDAWLRVFWIDFKDGGHGTFLRDSCVLYTVLQQFPDRRELAWQIWQLPQVNL